jgi:hypothetical protein
MPQPAQITRGPRKRAQESPHGSAAQGACRAEKGIKRAKREISEREASARRAQGECEASARRARDIPSSICRSPAVRSTHPGCGREGHPPRATAPSTHGSEGREREREREERRGKERPRALVRPFASQHRCGTSTATDLHLRVRTLKANSQHSKHVAHLQRGGEAPGWLLGVCAPARARARPALSRQAPGGGRRRRPRRGSTASTSQS